MKKFKDIKTGTQLLIGFGVVILLMMALSFVAWQQTDKLAKQTEDIYNHPLQVRRALSRFETMITAMHRDMRGLMLSESESEIEALLVQIEINKNEAFRQLDILEERFLGPISDIKIIREEFVKWNAIREETIHLLRQGKVHEAAMRTKSHGAGGTQVKKLFEVTTIVDDFSRNKADQFHSQAVQMNKDLNRQLFLISLAALIIAVLIAIFLSRLINHPLREILSALSAYRTGNKSARSGYTSQNQFGKLSDSFNETAEILETENLVSTGAARLSGIMLSEDDAHRFCHNLLKNLLEQTNSQLAPFTC